MFPGQSHNAQRLITLSLVSHHWVVLSDVENGTDFSYVSPYVSAGCRGEALFWGQVYDGTLHLQDFLSL